MILPIATSASARSFVGLIAGAVVAGTLVPLGGTLYTSGWSAGLPLLVVGVACFVLAEAAMFTGHRAAAREEAARTDRTQATVLDAKPRPKVRLGLHHPLRLAVSIGGHRVTRTLFVFPGVTYEPGTPIEVEFAPGDPANFLPVD